MKNAGIHVPLITLRLPCFALIAGLWLSSCVTRDQGDQFRSDIFNLQTRVVELESALKEKTQTTESHTNSANQRIASTNARLEAMERDIQQMKGDIDALKVGVTTGQMPGTEAEEGSIAQTLGDLRGRLETLEVNQSEILEAIEKVTAKKSGKGKGKAKGSDKDTDKSTDKKRTELDSPSDIQSAFKAKRYSHIADDAPNVLKSVKSAKDKQEVLYLYAESLYKLGRLRDAALQYNDFLDSNPKSSRAAHARLRMGDCFRHLGDDATAKIYYDELLSKNPKSAEAAEAKKRLGQLKKKKG